MCDQNGFDFSRPEPFAGDFNRVVTAAEDVPESVIVDRGPIAVDPNVGKTRPITVEITLSIFPKPARHSDPRLADYQLADLAAH